MTEQQQHPSSPPEELRRQWMDECRGTYYPDFQHLIDRAAQWAWDQREPEIQAAADAELEACLRHFEHFEDHWHPQSVIDDLRAARRPKPSLKEQALEALEAHFDAMEAGVPTYRPAHKATIRRALEALDD
jgi:hypothetical protein